MKRLLDAPARLHELGDGPELVAWLERQGFDAELVLFAGRAAAAAVLRRESEVEPQGAAGAFLIGFFAGVSLFEATSQPRSRGDTADSLASAAAAVAERGRHALIADHCDLAEVVEVETRVAQSVTGEVVGDDHQIVARLFESGLATALAIAA